MFFQNLQKISEKIIMCGRYYVDEDTVQAVRDLVRNQDQRVLTGDICPSARATVVTAREQRLFAEDMVWGIRGFQGSSLLINARAETIREKRTFREDVKSRRCVIPAKGFYEWSPEKEKYHFEDPGMTLYLAGCFDPRHCFVIITTAANESVRPVHDRMPLLITEEEIVDWIIEDSYFPALLEETPKLLRRWTQYQQLSLFDQDNM